MIVTSYGVIKELIVSVSTACVPSCQLKSWRPPLILSKIKILYKYSAHNGIQSITAYNVCNTKDEINENLNEFGLDIIFGF